VLAHETGHKVGVHHRERLADSKVPYTNQGRPSLNLNQFMQDPNKLANFWVEKTVYKLTTNAGFKLNQTMQDDEYVVTCGNYDASRVFWEQYWCPTGPTPYGTAQPPDWPFRMSANSQYAMAVDQITLQAQDGTVMCYTAQLNRVSDDQWKFAADDLGRFCLLPAGCGAN
jgi:hypothetical protein